MLLLQVW